MWLASLFSVLNLGPFILSRKFSSCVTTIGLAELRFLTNKVVFLGILSPHRDVVQALRPQQNHVLGVCGPKQLCTVLVSAEVYQQ